ncbi:hypothetical protein [Anaerotignum sp. MB30-C6]|nr:hypothetical protein [Anaerotignum sp. MB30-C6]WMI81829.1 hypothetical protein RBQ60_03630 [Anaerotignum sp. MB30-C6]
MGMKYIVNAFNYPYGLIDKQKRTGWLIVAVAYFVVFSLKYDGVDVSKRR